MEPEQLVSRVLGYIRQHNLISPPQKLVLAVSGGPDSVCLLHVMSGLREELRLELHIAHLNHRLRGEESDADARYVADLARRSGIPATVEEKDVRAYRAEHRLSLEEAAREVRYNFLAYVAREVGAGGVAVGHTTDDNIETILMHLVRGAGTRGLRGLQSSGIWRSAEGSLAVIRPLLVVSRRETTAYCEHYQLKPRLDITNLSMSPLRNRIRLQLLPLLKSYNPRIADALLRTARIATDDLSYIESEVSRLWDGVARKQAEAVVIGREAFQGLPPALQRHLILSALEGLLGNLRDIEMRHVEDILMAQAKPAGKRLSLPGGLIFSVEYDCYVIGREPTALAPFPALRGEYCLEIPGTTSLPGWRVKATINSSGNIPQLSEDGLTACFDFERAGSDILVRTRRAGDRFQPLGMACPKKLGEFMIDEKIPRTWRTRVPVVSSPEQVLWVVGWRIDERVKMTGETRRVLCLSFEKVG